MIVGYQGEPGAYSEEAAQALFPGMTAVGLRAFQLVFDALAAGDLDRAVLPVENTLGGIVQEVNDCLWETAGMRVVGERIHPVRHCLLGRAGEPVTRAISHPQALAQCRGWLHEHGIEAVVGEDTAGSARRLAEHPIPGTAAIASGAAGRRYGLDVLAEGIQDDDSNRTRFLVVEPGAPSRPESGAPGWRTSLAFVTGHVPGSLLAALQALSTGGVNLTRLDSRPFVGRPFEYRFYLDFDMPSAAAGEQALRLLEEAAMTVRLFGSYPAAEPTIGG
ncbi:MAG: prephenate dehydratase [Candidatus Dormibacteraceae bacterium]